MVSKTEESKLQELETQVENGGGGAWEYLSLVRKLKLRRSDKVLKHGLTILNDPKKRSNLGPDGNFQLKWFLASTELSIIIWYKDSKENNVCSIQEQSEMKRLPIDKLLKMGSQQVITEGTPLSTISRFQEEEGC
ncbi:hypothetical protein Tco_0879230 [Tanacetum coccineum]